MKKKIGCLHAHYSNIAYIEQAFEAYEVELVHFVDPGLVWRVGHDKDYTYEAARGKSREQLQWAASCGVDAALVTCTNYIALLAEEETHVQVPVINIDEPFFASLCEHSQPQIVLFTNPATVEGTMSRLRACAAAWGKELQVEARVMEGAFDLIMSGRQAEYTETLAEYLHRLIESEPDKAVSAAQLSMVLAADRVGRETGRVIGHPLASLQTYAVERLGLALKLR
ncbi:hypothetical protein [Paenibacillus hexagrammi]|uniref:Asp/Glu/hydantoin racemase n=1 Tax=Paenibacillus hexagrammi TaxID=2908839 RepID=A0ABY3SIS0_9BACL|nr:hypothetical protein [Paenibacillus sp. YPD9-1]UJF33388.1 hypothetical protein L0M14_28415 [Paenibacillus sp. YPD9-1]